MSLLMATPNLCPALCRVLWAAALEQSGPCESSHEPPPCRATTSTLDVPAFFQPTNYFIHLSQKSGMFPATGQKEISTRLWQPSTASVPSARGRASLFASPSPATFFPKLCGAKSCLSNWFSKPLQLPMRHAATPSSQYSPCVFLAAECTSFCLVLLETARGHQGNGPFTCDTATVAAQAFLFHDKTLLAGHFSLTSHSSCCLSAYCRLICIILVPHCPELEATADTDLTTSN